MKCETVFSGYDPEVRNAISHTGANGVTVTQNGVEFRSVKRGNPPIIKLVKWSYNELFIHMLELLEFLSSMDISSDIFGIDSLDIISSDFNTLNELVYYALSNEQQAEITKNFNFQLDKIRNNNDIELSKKLELLSAFLIKACKDREIALPQIGYINKDNALLIKIDRGNSLPTKDLDVFSAAAYLTRYAIIARTIFDRLAANYVIQEEYTEKFAITAKFSGSILDKYIEKEAGVMDLINDGEFFENEQILKIIVDFDALKAFEELRVGKPFPRLPR